MQRLINISFMAVLMVIVMVSGCIATPTPTVAPEASSDEPALGYGSPSLASSTEFSPLEIVTECLAAIIREKAGLKIAGVMLGPGEFTQIFAVPKKAGSLLVIRVDELTIMNPTSSKAPEVKLVLALSAFDRQGRNIYAKTVTSLHTGTVVNDASTSRAKELLEEAAKEALKQYVQDPVLRALIIKLQYPAIGGIF